MHLHTETLVGVASKLPDLRHVDWQIADGDGRPALLIQRRQNRYGESTKTISLEALPPDGVVVASTRSRTLRKSTDISPPALPDFANQLLDLKTLCPRLTTLEFVFESPFPPRKSNTEVPNLLLPYTTLDHLCISLRKLCQSMQQVVLSNLPISTQLFWPLQDDEEAVQEDEPVWPILTHFDLEFVFALLRVAYGLMFLNHLFARVAQA